MVVVGGTCMRLRYLITKKVKEYRERAGISQIELSRKLGKPDDFIQRLEGNKLSKSLTIALRKKETTNKEFRELVEEIAIILNVSVQDMMIDE